MGVVSLEARGRRQEVGRQKVAKRAVEAAQTKITDLEDDAQNIQDEMLRLVEQFLDYISLERGLSKIYACGLATDFCVSWSAQDAASAGLSVSVIEDACRGIDLDGSVDAAWKAMADAGVARIQAADIA